MKQHFINWDYDIDKCTLSIFLERLVNNKHTINSVTPTSYRDEGHIHLISALIITSK